MEPDYVKLKEIKPALSGYLREAQALLKRAPVPGEIDIHEIRVLMKKSRAALKLVAPQLESESFARDFRALREVGRNLSSFRETSVQRKILKGMKKECPGIFSALNGDEKLSELMKKEEPLSEPSPEMVCCAEKIIALITKAGYRIRFQTMNNIDPQLLVKELENTFSKVTDVYLRCRNNAKPENLHELRKIAKDFLYQLTFFRPLNPSVVKALEKKIDAMTRNLGRINDLSRLVKALNYKYSANKNLPALDELVIKIREKQDWYLVKVWPVAYKVFCPGQKLINILGFKLLLY